MVIINLLDHIIRSINNNVSCWVILLSLDLKWTQVSDTCWLVFVLFAFFLMEMAVKRNDICCFLFTSTFLSRVNVKHSYFLVSSYLLFCYLFFIEFNPKYIPNKELISHYWTRYAVERMIRTHDEHTMCYIMCYAANRRNSGIVVHRSDSLGYNKTTFWNAHHTSWLHRGNSINPCPFIRLSSSDQKLHILYKFGNILSFEGTHLIDIIMD